MPSNKYPWILRSYPYAKDEKKIVNLSRKNFSYSSKCSACHGNDLRGGFLWESYNDLYFPSLVNISKRETKDKLKSLEEFKKLNINGVERYSAIKITEPEGYRWYIRGCTESHCNLLRKQSEEGWEKVIIFEDDFFKWLVKRYHFVAGILKLDPYTCYDWHTDTRRGVGINMLLTTNQRSFCVFTENKNNEDVVCEQSRESDPA